MVEAHSNIKSSTLATTILELLALEQSKVKISQSGSRHHLHMLWNVIEGVRPLYSKIKTKWSMQNV